jgi:hypothetical protein
VDCRLCVYGIGINKKTPTKNISEATNTGSSPALLDAVTINGVAKLPMVVKVSVMPAPLDLMRSGNA